MKIEQAEESIRVKLAGDLSSSLFDVELLPETDSAYGKAVQKTRLSICYKMSGFDKPKSIGFAVQQEEATFEIVIQSRKLRGAGGLWDAFRLACISLLGFAPTNCRRLSAAKFEFEKREDTIFHYVWTVSCGSELVQDYTEPVTQGITQITMTPADPGFTGTVTT